MKKCKKYCGNPVEAERYDMCKSCWWAQDPRNIKNGGTVDLEPKKTLQKARKTVKTTIQIPTPMKQHLEISCIYDKKWDAHLVNFYAYNVYPQKDVEPVAEELTLAIKSKAEIEQIIDTLREVTKRMP